MYSTSLLSFGEMLFPNFNHMIPPGLQICILPYGVRDVTQLCPTEYTSLAGHRDCPRTDHAVEVIQHLTPILKIWRWRKGLAFFISEQKGINEKLATFTLLTWRKLLVICDNKAHHGGRGRGWMWEEDYW